MARYHVAIVEAFRNWVLQQGYASKEARHTDTQGSEESGGRAVTIPEDIAQAMKRQPDTTGQGRRDALIMCLLLDHGLRVEEVAILTAKAFDMKAGTFTLYRPKVDKVQAHTMQPQVLDWLV